ncbi:MAG TPA: restriction endonuclease subunit S [Bacillales bacterium]|nr:restriction endonuclease subunit S [Bacillales bacterium]
MSENNINVPKIRFPGFTDAWERRKLEEVASYRNGRAHEKDISDSGDFVVVNSKFVSTNGQIKKFANKQIEPLEKDEIAFVLSDVPNGKAIARTFLVPESNKYSLNQRIAGITPFDNTDPYFLSELMNRHHYFLRFDDGVGQTNLSKKDVEDFEEFYPAVEEQQKIGSFFKQLDHLITLHQRKLNHLQDEKKSLLQKMFPKNGADVPEIRFPGFTHAWEQRKLGKVVDVVKSYSLSRDVETDEDSGFRYVHYGDIHKKVADLIESAEQLPMIKAGDYDLLQKGDVIVADASEDYIGIAEPSVLLDTPSDKVVAGLHTIAMRPKETTPLFLYYLLHTDDFKKFGGRVGTGMKVFGITTKNLFKYPAVLPIKEEQEKIGKFFYELDHLITLHQRKLEHLQKQKKSLLQQMFV